MAQTKAKGKGESVQDRLAKMRERMEKTDVGEGGVGFWRPKVGRSIIRILPEVGSMEEGVWWTVVGKHYGLPGAPKAGEFCPSFVSEGKEPCPICEMVSVLWKGSESDKAMASQLGLRKQYWMNIVARDPKDKGGDTGDGPYVYTPGVTIFKYIQALMLDAEYGDITDIDDGIDLVVDRKGEGVKTEYQLMPRGRGRCPLHKDEDQQQEWLDNAKDLSVVMLTDDPEIGRASCRGRV